MANKIIGGVIMGALIIFIMYVSFRDGGISMPQAKTGHEAEKKIEVETATGKVQKAQSPNSSTSQADQSQSIPATSTKTQ